MHVRTPSRTLALALLLGALARPVHAQVVCMAPLGCPDATNSTIPNMILLVGHDGSGTPDPAGQFSIVVRDLANNPMANALIRIQIVVPDVAFCPTQQPVFEQVGPGAVEGHTDALGQFIATLMGTGVGPPLQLDAGPRAASVYADGNLLGSIPIAVLDLDGSGGMEINDLSRWLGDFGTGQPYLRDDFDGSGFVGVNDVSIWLVRFGAGSSVAGCTP